MEDAENKNEPTHDRLVMPDLGCLEILRNDAHCQILQENINLSGYEGYIIEQWATARRRVMFIATYTGNHQNKITVAVVSIPINPSYLSIEAKACIEELKHEGARPQETKLGTIFVTNLQSFPLSLTLIPINPGDLMTTFRLFIVNENLRRMACGGRTGFCLTQVTESSKTKFDQLYKTYDKLPLEYSVVCLVTYAQIALYYFGFLNPRYVDGLLCDITHQAILDWWKIVGLHKYSIEPSDGILGSTTIAALLGLLLSVRLRLATLRTPVPKDCFEINQFTHAIAYFQKQNKLKKTGLLDTETLNRIFKQTNKMGTTEKFNDLMTKVVKSTVHDLTFSPHVQTPAELETTDIEQFSNNTIGASLRLLWKGKKMPDANDKFWKNGGLDYLNAGISKITGKLYSVEVSSAQQESCLSPSSLPSLPYTSTKTNTSTEVNASKSNNNTMTEINEQPIAKKSQRLKDSNKSSRLPSLESLPKQPYNDDFHSDHSTVNNGSTDELHKYHSSISNFDSDPEQYDNSRGKLTNKHHHHHHHKRHRRSSNKGKKKNSIYNLYDALDSPKRDSGLYSSQNEFQSKGGQNDINSFNEPSQGGENVQSSSSKHHARRFIKHLVGSSKKSDDNIEFFSSADASPITQPRSNIQNTSQNQVGQHSRFQSFSENEPSDNSINEEKNLDGFLSDETSLSSNDTDVDEFYTEFDNKETGIVPLLRRSWSCSNLDFDRPVLSNDSKIYFESLFSTEDDNKNDIKRKLYKDLIKDEPSGYLSKLDHSVYSYGSSRGRISPFSNEIRRSVSFSLVAPAICTWVYPFGIQPSPALYRFDKNISNQKSIINGQICWINEIINEVEDAVESTTFRCMQDAPVVQYMSELCDTAQGRRDAVHSALDELDLMAARLQYETSALDARLRDVEETVSAFVSKVEALESRVEYIKKMRNRKGIFDRLSSYTFSLWPFNMFNKKIEEKMEDKKE